MSNARSISGLHPLAVLVAHVSALLSIAQQGSEAPGVVKDFAGPENKVPSGYLLCDGRAISRTTYAALFDAIGTTHGVGDGSTTFNIPDARGRSSAGPDAMGGVAAGRLTGASLGAAMGVESVTLTGAQSGSPAHSHTASSSHSLNTNSAGSHTHNVTSGSGEGDETNINPNTGNSGASVVNGNIQPAGAHTHSITGTISTTVNASAAQNASQAHTNVQPTIIFNKIIKT